MIASWNLAKIGPAKLNCGRVDDIGLVGHRRIRESDHLTFDDRRSECRLHLLARKILQIHLESDRVDANMRRISRVEEQLARV